MHPRTGLPLSLLVCIGLTACAPSPMQPFEPVPRRPLGAEHDVINPAVEHDKQTLAEEPRGDITLRVALAAAMLNNPDLASFAYSVRVAEARAIQAGLWENPELEAEFENFAGSGEFSGTDALETTVALSQTIPLGGDIRHRRRLAEAHGRLAGWDYEAARIALMAEVAGAYIDCLTAQKRVELARQSDELTRQLRDSIKRRVEAGDAPGIELSRAEVPAALSGIALGKAERALGSARTRLAAAWGGSHAKFTSVLGELDAVQPVPSVNSLADVISQNPAVARWAVELTARQAELKLARAEAQPDITGSVGYRNFNDTDEHALLVGVSIPLAVFDRGQGDVRAAELGVASVEYERRAAELRVAVALAEVHAALSDAYATATALRNEALPPATEAYDAIRSAFDLGDLGFLDVLDAERTLIELREQYLDALGDYHRSVAELEALIGQPLAIQTTDADTGEENQHE